MSDTMVPRSELEAEGDSVGADFRLGQGALTALLLMAPRRTWKDRLFAYAGGIAQFTGGAPEPAVLRWPDLATVSVQIVSGYEGESLSSCILRDRAGTTLTVESRYGDACEKVLILADRALAARLAGTLIARFDSGELDGVPNGLMARYVLWHAAARAGVAVTGDPPDPGQKPAGA